MQEFEEIFKKYGADYKATMNRFLNNKTMYLKLLGMLFQDDSLQNLDNALKESDLGSAFEAAHTLKGVVGNLGLTPLLHTLDNLVKPLRAREIRDDYSKLYHEVELELKNANSFFRELKGDNQI